MDIERARMLKRGLEEEERMAVVEKRRARSWRTWLQIRVKVRSVGSRAIIAFMTGRVVLVVEGEMRGV